jgi:hypothetical protein
MLASSLSMVGTLGSPVRKLYEWTALFPENFRSIVDSIVDSILELLLEVEYYQIHRTTAQTIWMELETKKSASLFKFVGS